ncbi:MAG: DUF1697 domain-containing protein [Candidatus Saccharimonadia bacterium]
MKYYVVLLRGINVGGKNIIPMAALKSFLEDLGFKNVSTYIASGNVILASQKTPNQIKDLIEATLTAKFNLSSDLIKVLVLNRQQLIEVVDNKPEGFGNKPEKYHSDVIFLLNINQEQALAVFNPRAGVDKVWLGNGVIYSQRLSAKRTQSRLSQIMSSVLYKSMSIRTWNTTIKLVEMLQEREH